MNLKTTPKWVVLFFYKMIAYFWGCGSINLNGSLTISFLVSFREASNGFQKTLNPNPKGVSKNTRGKYLHFVPYKKRKSPFKGNDCNPSDIFTLNFAETMK